MIEIKFYKLFNDARMPTFATENAAGFDFYAYQDYFIESNTHKLIHTGLSVEIPASLDCKYEMQIRPRSGLALHNKITILNTPGTIDSDYRGEIMIILMNFGGDYRIKKFDRIAQGVICKLPIVKICEVDSIENLSQTQRGSKGFGSTGR